MRVNVTITLSLEALEKLEKLKQFTRKPKSRIIEELIKKYYEEVVK